MISIALVHIWMACSLPCTLVPLSTAISHQRPILACPCKQHVALGRAETSANPGSFIAQPLGGESHPGNPLSWVASQRPLDPWSFSHQAMPLQPTISLPPLRPASPLPPTPLPPVAASSPGSRAKFQSPSIRKRAVCELRNLPWLPPLTPGKKIVRPLPIQSQLRKSLKAPADTGRAPFK